MSPFHELFGYTWDMIMRIAFDPAHEFGNLGKDLLGLINNKDKMRWTNSRAKSHRKKKRFKKRKGFKRYCIYNCKYFSTNSINCHPHECNYNLITQYMTTYPPGGHLGTAVSNGEKQLTIY